MADQQGALITGIPWREWAGEGQIYYNSVTVLGGGEGLYHKQKLVPFGEYVPLQQQIRGLIPFFDLPASSFSRGRPDQPNLTAMGRSVSPFICYEILYPSLVAQRSHDSDVLLTISNDAWFGTSAGPHQHFQMTRMRSLETGRWLLRATNNGISATIRPDGKVADRLPQFERALLEAEVRTVRGTTPFMHSGPSPVLLLALAMLAFGRRRPHQR
jgi:apolipoprotein N-acyltransferase